MNERERILELVREGALSVDEALVLLESLGKKESKQTEARDFTAETTRKEPIVEPEDLETFIDEEPFVDDEFFTEEEPEDAKAEDTKAEDQEAMKQIEKELEDIANELNQFSAEIDQLNEELTGLNKELSEVEGNLAERQESLTEEYTETKKELENQIINLQKEIELISTVDEVDHYEEIKSLNVDLTNAMEKLNRLENRALDDEEIKHLEKKVQILREEIAELNQEKNQKLKEMHSTRLRQWTTKAKQVSENLDIPEEWRTGANKTIDKASDIFGETSKTIGDVFRQTIDSTKETLGKVDWKDLDFNWNISRKAQSEFDHEWLFENTTATILDFKNANGNIQYKPSVNDHIKISAHIKLFGKMEEATPLAALEARSIINIDEDKFTFHIPNKNIEANMIVYLPQRDYDYMRSNSFNGDVTFQDLKTRDIYVKATNGNIVFNHFEATMLELKGTNGDITLKDIVLRDLLIHTANGDIRVVGDVQSSDVNTTNGDIRLTLNGEELIRVAGSSVNGDVKISFPADCGLEIEAKSIFGKVKSRLSNTQASLTEESKGKTHRLHRIGSENICRVDVQTTTGNVLFKDTDKK